MKKNEAKNPSSSFVRNVMHFYMYVLMGMSVYILFYLIKDIAIFFHSISS